MNDYSYGSGWADGNDPVDYGISPYGTGYSNIGLQVPSFNNSNSGYSSSGTNYSLGTSYGGSSGGFSTPSFGSASNNYMGTQADYGLSPYQPLYSNTGIKPMNTWDQQLSADAMRNNYGGTDSGGNYIPYPANYFNPAYTYEAPEPTYSAPEPTYSAPDPYAFDSSGYNTFGFNLGGFDRGGFDQAGFTSRGIDREGYSFTGFNPQGINRQGLDMGGRNYNPGTGLNYKTGGFNYDSKVSPFENSSIATAATADIGAAPTEFSPNSMVKEDLRKRLERDREGNSNRNSGQSGQGLSALVSGLNSLFSSKNAGKTASTLAGLYQGRQAAKIPEEQVANIAQQKGLTDEQRALVGQQQAISGQQQAFAQKQAADLASMFGQESSYAQALRKQLDRKDAQGGRRSQYGTREVELQARLAEAAAKVAPSIASFNAQANTIGNNMLSNGNNMLTNGNNVITNGKLNADSRRERLNTKGQQMSRVIDLAGTAGVFDGLAGMFGGIGNNGNRRGNRDNYDLQGENKLTGGGNFWDSWLN